MIGKIERRLTVHSPLPRIVVRGSGAGVRGVNHLAHDGHERSGAAAVAGPTVERCLRSAPGEELFGVFYVSLFWYVTAKNVQKIEEEKNIGW